MKKDFDFYDLFATIDDMIFVADRIGKIWYANNAVSAKLGYSDEELKKMHISELYPENVRKDANKIISNVSARKCVNNSFSIQAKDGKLIPAESRIWSGFQRGKKCIFCITKDLSGDQEELLNFNLLFTENPVAMAVSDPTSGKFLEANAAFLKKLHYRKSDVIGKTAADLDIFIRSEKQKRAAGAMNKRKYTHNTESKIRAKTGEISDCIVSQRIIKNRTNIFQATALIDITKHKRREKKIRMNLGQQMILAKISARLNRYKNFQKTMNLILKKIAIHIGADHAYIFENSSDRKTSSNTFEWCAENVKPQIDSRQNIFYNENLFYLKNLDKKGVFFSRDISKLPTDVKTMLEPQNIKSMLVLPLIVNNKFFGFIGFDRINRENKWHDSEIIMLRTIAASISGIYEKKQHIREINYRTEQIGREKNKIETIIRGIGDGVFVVDRKFRISLINPVACRLSGHSEEEALGKNYSEILLFVREPDPLTENSDFIRRAITTGITQSMPDHTLLISKKGEKIPVADSAVPLKNTQGDIVGCVIVFRDATREREIDRMKSEFVSLASHQLKTPMTGIKWMSELVLRESLSSKQKEYMNDVNESINKLVSLIDDLLNLSHIETGRHFNIVKRNADLCGIIEEIIKDSRKLTDTKKVDVKLEKNPAKLILTIDRDKIKQAIGNVINNAIKYSYDEGKVSIDLRKKANEAVIMIKDGGIGIPQAEQKRIFEKFFRASNVSQSDYGTGLGLIIARSIIEAHGGHIWFESKANKGTIFYIELPFKNY